MSISYDDVAAGNALENARKDYKNVYKEQQAKANIPIAWEKLIKEKDEILLDVISEKVESICGFKPTHNQVITYLGSFSSVSESSQALSVQAPLIKESVSTHTPQPAPTVPKKTKSRSKIKVMFPDGVEICMPKVNETMVETIRKIGFEKVKSLNIQMYGLPLVSNKKVKEDKYNWSDAGAGVFVLTHSNTEKKLSQLIEINDRLALNLTIKTA